MIAFGDAKTLALVCAAVGVAVMVGRFSRSDSCPDPDHHLQDSQPSGQWYDKLRGPGSFADLFKSEREMKELEAKLTRKTPEVVTLGQCCSTDQNWRKMYGEMQDVHGETCDVIRIPNPDNRDTYLYQWAYEGECVSGESGNCNEDGGDCAVKDTFVTLVCTRDGNYYFSIFNVPGYCYCRRTGHL